MASHGEGYGVQKHHGSDGNPVRQTDEYGNPVQHTTGGTMGEYGTGGLTGAGTGETGTHGMHGTGTTGTQGVGLSTGTDGQSQLHRSGSSSSSEDDEMGGRRKKGIKDKIKEKLPGGHKQEEQQTHTTTATPVTGGSYGTTGGHGTTATGEQTHEKKGMVEKIKEKLPGGGHH